MKQIHLSGDKSRSLRITIRITPKTRSILELLAQHSDTSISEVARQQLSEVESTVVVEAINKEEV